MSESPDHLPPSALQPAGEHPLKSVWFEPGPTIAQICATNPGRLYFQLASVWGASYNLSLAVRRGISSETLLEAGISSPWVIVGVNVLVGSIFGIVVLWVLSFVYAWLGRALGGQGKARDVRTVLAWSSVPHIPNLVAATLVIVIGGTSMLTATHPGAPSLSNPPLQIVFLLVNGIFGIWGFVISVAGLKAVMRISAPRAVVVIVLGGLLTFAALLTPVLAVVKLVSG